MDPAKRTRLIQLLGMMGSAHDGEILNAARLAQRFIGGEGLTWEEVLTQKSAGGNSGRVEGDRYRDGYSDGYHKGLAEGRAQGSTVKKVVTWTGWSRFVMDRHEKNLSDWEQGFIESFISRGWATPTPKQYKVFERIAEKLELDLPDTWRDL